MNPPTVLQPSPFWCNVLQILMLVIVMVPSVTEAQGKGSTRSNLITVDDSEGVLMLNSGRIVTGQMRPISTGYLVVSHSGNVVISRDEVRFVANNLSELYLLQKRELKDPSVKEQMKLAEWCFAQKLNAYAAREFLSVLERDPSNESARRLLARLDDDQQRAKATDVSLESTVPAKKLADDEARSLAGLTGATAERFSSSIQPLLQNKCGNVRCHGASADHEFRLSRGSPGAGSHRIYAERNLALLLKYIDLDHPQDSRLLKIGKGAHAGQTIFTGRSGADQQKLLTEWVLNAAQELKPKTQPKSVAVFGPSSAASKPSASTNGEVPTKPSSNAPSNALNNPEALLTETQKTDFRKVVDAAESDAFDPEAFNHLFRVARD